MISSTGFFWIKKETKNPLSPSEARFTKYTSYACLCLLRVWKKKRKSLFVYWKYPIYSFYFQAEIRLLLTKSSPIFFNVRVQSLEVHRHTSCSVFPGVLLTAWPDLRFKLKLITDILSPGTLPPRNGQSWKCTLDKKKVHTIKILC